MLQLQRASAGSGKTYTLAKKFIWFLITIKDHERRLVRLRSEAEIADAVSRILAITFTNKATAEMKLRIIDKLAALADTENLKITPQLLADTDYLEEFSRQLNVSHQKIAHAAKVALTTVLNQYSDFHVSTIDSFFQTVLRTFAYESNLNDSYQVEIDSDYISAAAIDSTLDEVNTSGTGKTQSSFWISLLMNDASAEKGAVWNVFQKSDSDETIYSKLRGALKRMESEEFKEKRNKLDEYLASEKGASRLAEAYMRLRHDMEESLRKPFSVMINARQEFVHMLSANGLTAKDDCVRYVDGHLDKIGNYKFDETDGKWFKPVNLAGGKSILKKGVKCAAGESLTEKAREMYEAFVEWSSLFESERHILWNIYSATFPYLGLLLEARDKINSFLDSNNLIQLGETNSMLMRIIGDSDTPFIYERLGTALNHYLIDEFQDTSKMQWENLRKLLRESVSRDEDNLIIGDAKQSIYRFRNAEPSLITSVVPAEFPENVHICGMSKADNTNWRSCRRIVEFNNFFFRALAMETEKIQAATYEGTDGSLDNERIDFGNLYGNVVQYPKKQEDEGYVEIRFFDAPREQGKDKAKERDAEQAEALREIGPLVSSLIARGYRQKDIAILIDTKKLGNATIDAIIEYNSTLDDDTPKIEFINEDSLAISSSEAVGIIVSTLQKLAEGTRTQTKDDNARSGDDPEKTGKEEKIHLNWNDIKSDYAFFAMQHPEMTPSEQIAEFIKGGKPADSIKAMMHGMQAVTLPSLVESIVENFVSADLRRSQAVFIAGFQDLVLDYCERYASDVASFLIWWESRGKYLSVASPEDTDAVRIMTIHKSKGLEFKCVILPFEAKGITPSSKKTEWRWVEPSPLFKDYDLPEWLPVETTDSLLKTEYADIYRKYSDMYMMDRLNSLYVAFTRAKCELYVFTKYINPENKRASHTSSAWFLKEICGNMEEYLPENMTDIISPELRVAGDDGRSITFGHKYNPKSDEKATTDRNLKTDISFKESRVVEEYGVNSCPRILHCLENDPPTEDEKTLSEIMQAELEESATVTPESVDTDPRSDGNLLHSIMESVRTVGDLHRSVLNMKMRGLISSEQAMEWEPMLRNAIKAVETRGWFDGSRRVMNERSIIRNGTKTRRPDRVMVSPDGKSAVIVDYKFGETPDDEHNDRTLNAYRRQVKDYAYVLRQAMRISDVSAYIWYMRSGKIYQADV